MGKSDRERRIDAVMVLAEAFRQKASEVTVKAYLMGLDDIATESVELAAARAIKASRFMPTVAELRELAGESSVEDRAVLAWGAAERAVVDIGDYRHVDFDDPLINATIRNLGGWPTFVARFSSADAEKWVRQEFCKTYASLHRSGVNGDCCRPLPGISEGRGIDEHGRVIPCIPVVVRTGLPGIEHRPRRERVERAEVPRVEFSRP